jgi:hypothetical protein
MAALEHHESCKFGRLGQEPSREELFAEMAELSD